MNMEKNEFSIRLEELLKARRMTQKELAIKSGVTEAAMSHYVKGDRTPRSAVLSRIATALNTTSDYLMEGVPQDYVNEIGYAKRLIARNVDQMTTAEKREILSILLGGKEE
jgi:transcriptional regulator with XRE-family HTH domain